MTENSNKWLDLSSIIVVYYSKPKQLFTTLELIIRQRFNQKNVQIPDLITDKLRNFYL